ncbi:hypothetical protein CHLNCDRAFT_51004 [Chlorella variabilis]|uniref:Prolyl endopeptidase n=1 Tax=Chlorella variabilis TaxID=554065 RepID=E1Z963_CHLVA|nr:hypothetical protein CHLNCDRAFT_51004 [Chlorella variabilis]EFN57461.1 hypothetical protein CHLNCDRAFT_51004 [Chlorella variabilis]|eukprot:XP_005849563.1 hypothetical protein CHLNCDRAFT_51004 [Chlorella variabilis]
MLQLVPSSQVSAPERLGAYEYYVQQMPGRPHPCYMRRVAHVAAPRSLSFSSTSNSRFSGGAPGGEVVLDVNDLAAVHGEYVQVGQVKLTRCGRHVAFTLDAGDGSEAFGAFTRDLRTGALRHLATVGSVVSLEWAADGRTLLCTQPNGLGRPWRVLGADAAAAAAGDGAASWPLFEEEDERFFVELGRTKDWSFLTINCNSKASSEVHLLPADLRGSGTAVAVGPRLVQQRTPGLEYFVEHSCGQLYILSNARGETNYAVFRVPTSVPDLGQVHWQRVVGEREAGGAMEDMDMLEGWLVLYLRRHGRQQVAALPLGHGLPLVAQSISETTTAAAAAEEDPAASAGAAAGAAAATVSALAQAPAEVLRVAPLPDWALSVVAGANADYYSSHIRLLLSSPVHPEAAFDWHLGREQLAEWRGLAPLGGQHRQQQQERQQEQPPGQQHCDTAATMPLSQQQSLSPPGYKWQQLWATSPDGTQVPLTVAHAAALAPPAPCPCLLVVYGAYGHCLPADYLPERIPLLHRGWVLALAHVRGGGELGRRWHAAGRGGAKATSVDDLEACLDHLVSAGYTAPGMVALEAHSAGGLAAGALLNRRPNALGAALLEAPFVDVLSAMCQPDLPLTRHEYEEFGDPGDPHQFNQIRALCPYQTVRQAAYPPVLLTCSQQDMRVPYWGPLKFAARLQAAAREGQAGRVQGGPILLLPDGQAGHFVHERDLFQTKAQQYAFLVTAIEGRL